MTSLGEMDRERNELIEINLNTVFEIFLKLRLLDREPVQQALIDCESESITLCVPLPGLTEYSYALQRDTSLDCYGGSDGWNRGYRLLVIHHCPDIDTIYQQQYRLIRDLYNGLLHYHKESTEIHRISSERSELIYLSDGGSDKLMLVDY